MMRKRSSWWCPGRPALPRSLSTGGNMRPAWQKGTTRSVPHAGCCRDLQVKERGGEDEDGGNEDEEDEDGSCPARSGCSGCS